MSATVAPHTCEASTYAVIAAATASSFVAFPSLGWHHWVLGIEVALISLFATFWLVQTRELWPKGLR